MIPRRRLATALVVISDRTISSTMPADALARLAQGFAHMWAQVVPHGSAVGPVETEQGVSLMVSARLWSLSDAQAQRILARLFKHRMRELSRFLREYQPPLNDYTGWPEDGLS